MYSAPVISMPGFPFCSTSTGISSIAKDVSSEEGILDVADTFITMLVSGVDMRYATKMVEDKGDEMVASGRSMREGSYEQVMVIPVISGNCDPSMIAVSVEC